MRKILAILVLSVSLAGCSAAGDTGDIATLTDNPTTSGQFYSSPGTGPVGERFLPNRTGQEPAKVIAASNQFYISADTGPVGERFLPNAIGQPLEKVTVTPNQFYVSTGTGPVGERFLVAESGNL